MRPKNKLWRKRCSGSPGVDVSKCKCDFVMPGRQGLDIEAPANATCLVCEVARLKPLHWRRMECFVLEALQLNDEEEPAME
jgi:hypothetical protein